MDAEVKLEAQPTETGNGGTLTSSAANCRGCVEAEAEMASGPVGTSNGGACAYRSFLGRMSGAPGSEKQRSKPTTGKLVSISGSPKVEREVSSHRPVNRATDRRFKSTGSSADL